MKFRNPHEIQYLLHDHSIAAMRYCSLSRMLVLATFLVSVPTTSHAAPHRAMCQNCESSINQYQKSRNAIEEILFDTIFNSTDNSRIVKRTFREQPGTHKICILLAYNVTCDEDSDISPQCNESDPQCILGLYNILWTEFDTSDTAGTLLLYLASDGFSVFGFEWAGACDLLQDDSNAANLSLVLPSSLCNGNQSDIDLKEEIMSSLIYITTLVSCIHCFIYEWWDCWWQKQMVPSLVTTCNVMVKISSLYIYNIIATILLSSEVSI